jgi:superfamily II DNA or RNA helicase
MHHTITLDTTSRALIGKLKTHGIESKLNCTQLTVPHTRQATIVLREEGWNVPAPILSQYDFPTTNKEKPAFQVQKWTCGMMTLDMRSYVLNDLGTGKTRCVLWSYDFLKSQGLANKLLVIAPLSALMKTWGKELKKEFYWLKFRILHGTKKQRVERLNDNVDVYIINHDGVKVIEDELMARKDIDCVCADEVSMYRDGGAQRTKIFKQVIFNKPWVWGLTGSPMPKAVTDVWGPCSAITPETVPTYFSTFRAQLMLKKGPYLWVPKAGAEEYAVSCMRPSVRYTLDEVTELPEQIREYYEADLTHQQQQAYDAMRSKALTMIADKTITAANAGAVLSKLLQIGLGWVYNAAGEIAALDNKPRLQLILDLIDSSAQKVILFANFKSAIAGLSQMLTGSSVDHAVVTGDVTYRERNVIFDNFQDTKKYKVLLAHPVCMSHSLTLTAATTTIWAGPTTSLEVFLQANARTYRIGQEHKTLVAMIGGSQAEKRMYQILGRNEKAQNAFLTLVELLTAKENEAV